MREDVYQTDDYLTDGKRLYRVIRRFGASGERYAELEDCRTLESFLWSGGQLARLGLRLVRRRPAPVVETLRV